MSGDVIFLLTENNNKNVNVTLATPIWQAVPNSDHKSCLVNTPTTSYVELTALDTPLGC